MPAPLVPSALCGNHPWQLDRVFGRGRKAELAAEADLFPEYVTAADFPRQAERLREVEVVFSTWGMSEELARMLAELPGLKAFFYAAGTVRAFAKPLLDRDILVVSAWAANAVPVSQFALAQILLSLKGYFRNVREARKPVHRGRLLDTDAPGAMGETVALLGCGMVGK